MTIKGDSMETDKELEMYGDGYMAGTADGIRNTAKIVREALGDFIEAIDKGELKIADIAEQYGEQVAIAYNKANAAFDELEALLATIPEKTVLTYTYGE